MPDFFKILKAFVKLQGKHLMVLLATVSIGCAEDSKEQGNNQPPPPAPQAPQEETPAPPAPADEIAMEVEPPILPAAPVEDPAEAALRAYEKEIAFQQNIVQQEAIALDEAYAARNQSVRIGTHLRDMLAYGISSGYLGQRFLQNTNNMEGARKYFDSTRAARVPAGEQIALTAAEAEATANAAAAAEGISASRASMLRTVGAGIMRTAEFTGAVVFGIIFTSEVFDTGRDLYIRFNDTDEIRTHRASLEQARRNLDTAQANLQAAIMNSQKQ